MKTNIPRVAMELITYLDSKIDGNPSSSSGNVVEHTIMRFWFPEKRAWNSSLLGFVCTSGVRVVAAIVLFRNA